MRYILILLLIFVSACHKGDDGTSMLPPDEGSCFIRGWHDTTFFDAVRNSVFTYNEYGDPISIESQYCCTGTEPHFFTYDLLKRLIKHEHYSLNTTVFSYNDKDTLPVSAGETRSYGETYELQFAYDNNQRIAKVTRTYVYTQAIDSVYFDSLLTEHTVTNYVYDGQWQSC
jgi:hypothetical protein